MHGNRVRPAHTRRDSSEPHGNRSQNWVEAIIETPRGSRNKYQYDHERGAFRLDRNLYSAVHYPTDYGFIEETLSGDGDPLDVLVLIDEPTFAGCHVRVRPLGMIIVTDEKGVDEKILAVAVDDPRYAAVISLDNLPAHWKREIANFFRTYKDLQNIQTDVGDWSGASEAWQLIAVCQERYRAKARHIGER
jgi:inorganic pyrophosphatase